MTKAKLINLTLFTIQLFSLTTCQRQSDIDKNIPPYAKSNNHQVYSDFPEIVCKTSEGHDVELQMELSYSPSEEITNLIDSHKEEIISLVSSSYSKLSSEDIIEDSNPYRNAIAREIIKVLNTTSQLDY